MRASTRPAAPPTVSFTVLNRAYWIVTSPRHAEENGRCGRLRAAVAVDGAARGDGPAARAQPWPTEAERSAIGRVLTTARPVLLACAVLTVIAALVAGALG